MSCSSVQRKRSSPKPANFFGSVSPLAKARRMRSPLTPNRSLTILDSLIQPARAQKKIGHRFLNLSNAIAGRPNRARAELRELYQRALHHYVSPYGFAQVYAALGDNSAALQMLDRAAAEHAFELMFLKVDRSFDRLRAAPEFQDLLQKIGFPK
jgi:hypothetical protein